MRRALPPQLPAGVFRISRGAREYWYYQRRRGRPDHGPLIRLPEHGTPEFWSKIAEIQRGHAGPEAGTFDALIAAYQAHRKWESLAEGSRKTYRPALAYIARRWGPLRVDGLSPAAVQAFLDEEFATRPSMGNLTLAVLKTILKFGVSRGYGDRNPAREVETLEEDPNSAKPWPEHLWRRMVDTGPPELARLAFLGRAIGQRVSDLVKLRPADRDGTGIVTRIQKTRRRTGDAEHWCPLKPEQVAVIDGWLVFPTATYIADEKGRPFTPNSLRRRFDRFVAGDPEMAAAGLRIHGLRAMAVCDRRIEGLREQQIQSQIGMSLAKVMHYSRGINQRLAAGDEREQNGPVKTARLSHENTGG